MRGGTSKGVFIEDRHLPAEGPERVSTLLRLMGSPDPMQLDGLGGTHSSTSKVVTLAPSDLADVDVDYRFAQIGVDCATVDETGNCGNLTSAVGPYAIDAGWVTATEPITTVVLRNLNTGARVRAQVPTVAGRAAATGDQLIAGVPTPGPRIVTDYLDPAGAIFGTPLPSGQAVDRVDTWPSSPRVSIVDVTHPVAFVSTEVLGIADDAEPAALNAQPDLLREVEALRAACVALLPARAPSINLPRLVLLRSAAHARSGGADLSAIGVSAGRFHHALPVTSTLCTAAAAAIPGTVVHQAVGERRASTVITIRHPKGNVDAIVEMAGSDRVVSVGIVRTARRLLQGVAVLAPAPAPHLSPLQPSLEESHDA